jgi:hypothetical protein
LSFIALRKRRFEVEHSKAVTWVAAFFFFAFENDERSRQPGEHGAK